MVDNPVSYVECENAGKEQVKMLERPQNGHLGGSVSSRDATSE